PRGGPSARAWRAGSLERQHALGRWRREERRGDLRIELDRIVVEPDGLAPLRRLDVEHAREAVLVVAEADAQDDAVPALLLGAHDVERRGREPDALLAALERQRETLSFRRRRDRRRPRGHPRRREPEEDVDQVAERQRGTEQSHEVLR